MANEDSAQRTPQLSAVLSPLAAWALALGCVVGWGSFVMPSSTFLPTAGPLGTAIAFVVGGVMMLVVIANYGIVATRSTGRGGVYTYVRDTFGPNHAFFCGWCLLLAYFSAMVSNATALALAARSVMGSVFQWGFHYTLVGYDVYLGEGLLAIAAVVTTAQICKRGMRPAGIVQTLLVLGLVAGALALFGFIWTDSDVSLSSIKPAFSPEHTPLAGTFIMLAEVPWTFIGFEVITQVSEECRFPARLFAPIMTVAVVVGTFLYLVIETMTAAVVPAGFDGWVSYLASLNASTGLEAIPSLNASHLLAGSLGSTISTIMLLCAVLSGILGFFIASTRLIYEMALDRSLPVRLARLDEAQRIPVEAARLIVTVSIVVPFLGRNVLAWVIDLMSIGALVAYIYTSLVAIDVARREGRAVGVGFGMLGVAISAACGLLLLVPFPGIDHTLSKEAYVVLFMWVALGVNFFTPTMVRPSMESDGASASDERLS